MERISTWLSGGAINSAKSIVSPVVTFTAVVKGDVDLEQSSLVGQVKQPIVFLLPHPRFLELKSLLHSFRQTSIVLSYGGEKQTRTGNIQPTFVKSIVGSVFDITYREPECFKQLRVARGSCQKPIPISAVAPIPHYTPGELF